MMILSQFITTITTLLPTNLFEQMKVVREHALDKFKTKSSADVVEP